jgi:hypothetical protein
LGARKIHTFKVRKSVDLCNAEKNKEKKLINAHGTHSWVVEETGTVYKHFIKPFQRTTSGQTSLYLSGIDAQQAVSTVN